MSCKGLKFILQFSKICQNLLILSNIEANGQFSVNELEHSH